MPEDEFDAATVYDIALGTMKRDPSLLVMHLKVHESIVSFVLDRRVAERLRAGLAKVVPKLAAPSHEN